MFGKQFYPTPKEVAEKMLEDVDFDFIGSVLEPSAGKGDLVNVVVEKMAFEWRRQYDSEKIKGFVDCIEIDPNLQHVLKGNKYRVVHNDFLTFDTYKSYDLILMNPPFADGDKHLLKAMDMQRRTGGAVICLLNAETINNPYTSTRQKLLRELDESGAKIEFVKGAFAEAERKTDVEIAIVKAWFKAPEIKSVILQEYLRKKDTEDDEEDGDCTDLTHSNFIKSIVQQYNAEVSAGLQLIDEYRAMKPNILQSLDPEAVANHGILTLTLDKGGNTINDVSKNAFVEAVRTKYWKALFQSKEFVSLLTSELMHSLMEKVSELAGYDFSLYNIYTIRLEVSKEMNRSVEDTILKLFEDFTYTYSYEKEGNRHYFDGWKTNCAYMVNKRVIISLQAWDWGRYHPDYYKTGERLRDIEKAFNYLDGGRTGFDDISIRLETAKNAEQTKKVECKYFYLTFFKKGTCHIEFKDMELLKKFNIFGCQRKGWLPPVYGKKKYGDLHPDEKDVVDSFEGEKEYGKVLHDTDFYIHSTGDLLRLGGPQ